MTMQREGKRRRKRGRNRRTSDPSRAWKAIEFLNLGYRDYIGARVLLRNRLPLQGALLGATAIEKYVKAIAAVRGNVLSGHLKPAHVALLRNFAPDLIAKLNVEFLRFLARCYKLRYSDRLAPEFNVAVYARETLAELDYTIFHCELQINAFRGNRRLRTPYRVALAAKSEGLIAENFLLLKEAKQRFLQHPDVLYAMRNRAGEGMLEVEGRVSESPKDGQFNREALRRVRPEELGSASPPAVRDEGEE